MKSPCCLSVFLYIPFIFFVFVAVHVVSKESSQLVMSRTCLNSIGVAWRKFGDPLVYR